MHSHPEFFLKKKSVKMLVVTWILLSFPVLLLCSYLKFRFHSKYFWKRRNLPYLEPRYLFGNFRTAIFTESIWEIIKKYYLENRDKPLLGIWIYRIPVLLVQDINLIKNVFIKDFEHFHDRGLPISGKKDPLGGHLFNLTGSKWKNVRVKLTPTFTSGKIKMLFSTMVECGEKLQDFLKVRAESEETIEWKDILSRFSIDIITSCAFGIQSNSLNNPNDEFLKYGKRIFSPGIPFVIYNTILSNYGFLQKVLPFYGRPKEVTNFFMDTIKKTMKYREVNNIQVNDFLDLLIRLKNEGKVKSPDNNSGDASAAEFTFETAAAQAFAFFFATLESPTTTMMFTLYELARNLDMQEKLQKEIDLVATKCKGKITFEAVQEMEYLDCIINETLRMYPPVSFLPRKCTKDYTFPGSNITIKKGTFTIIPLVGIQNDPEYFQNPEKFDPGRFTVEQKSKRDKFWHMPFGEGPRVCIGTRFGLMQCKIGLTSIFSKYNIKTSETTQIPLKMDPALLLPSPSNGMNLKITKRENINL